MYSSKIARLLEEAWFDIDDSREKVVEGYARGTYGLEINGVKLLECGAKKWNPANFYIVKGYAYGKHGLERSPVKLLELAKDDIGLSRQYVAKGLFTGKLGFEKDLKKLKDFATEGWYEAKILITILERIEKSKELRNLETEL